MKKAALTTIFLTILYILTLRGASAHELFKFMEVRNKSHAKVQLMANVSADTDDDENDDDEWGEEIEDDEDIDEEESESDDDSDDSVISGTPTPSPIPQGSVSPTPSNTQVSPTVFFSPTQAQINAREEADIKMKLTFKGAWEEFRAFIEKLMEFLDTADVS